MGYDDGSTINHIFATVGGGYANYATASGSTVAGGYTNTASGQQATVGGGMRNDASLSQATVAGGKDNMASGNYSTVGGGNGNNATGDSDTVSGGIQNTASNVGSTVGGGSLNTASGLYSTIPGGYQNSATAFALAAGRRAKANHLGAFVWADSTDADLATTANNQFLVRASGGVTMYTNSLMTVGARLAPGSGTWSSVSDKNVKANVAPASPRAILDKVAALPIGTWNYTSQDAAIRHIGPMAQDFYAAFQVGEDDLHISTIDADGVALAAIQGLNEVVSEKETEIQDLERQVSLLQKQGAEQQSQINELRARMDALQVPGSQPVVPLGQLAILAGLLAVAVSVSWRWPRGAM